MTNKTREQIGSWIPVNERLPKENVEVLAVLQSCATGKQIQRVCNTVKATDHDWEADGYEIANCWDLTHWTPLPEPPEAQSDE